MTIAMDKRRARGWGLPFPGIPGPLNAITDVPGVEVGMTTLISGDGPLVQGRGPVRTGVTAVLPHGHSRELSPVWAGTARFNGNGEMTGVHWIADGGYFLGPVCLTNTHSVGIVHHAVVEWMIAHYDAWYRQDHMWAMPVVAETYDGVLNDINGQHVKPRHVHEALDSARGGPVAEGNVGGGTGMIAYGFKGGTGTASRQVNVGEQGHTVGVLVQANHGIRPWLTVLGVPVGLHWEEDPVHQKEHGSIIVVIATDIPMLPHQLARVARRGTIGIARGGTPGGNSSGDLFLAFSVANPGPVMEKAAAWRSLTYLNDEAFDPVYEAVAQATEEAVVNALLAADAMASLKPHGRVIPALDPARLMEHMRRYGRL